MNRTDGASTSDADQRLPLCDSRRYDRTVIGSHLILYGYGLWLPNDPRGSGSESIRQDKFADLGAIHRGRKREQPARSKLSSFYGAAAPRLEFPTIWFDDAMRQAIAEAFGQVVASRRYTTWSCAILRNHAHICIRRHRDDPVTIWRSFADASAAALYRIDGIPQGHPVWSNRPYRVFLKTPEDIRRVILYIERNPDNDGLPPQSWPFIRTYDGWPHRKKCVQ